MSAFASTITSVVSSWFEIRGELAEYAAYWRTRSHARPLIGRADSSCAEVQIPVAAETDGITSAAPQTTTGSSHDPIALRKFSGSNARRQLTANRMMYSLGCPPVRGGLSPNGFVTSVTGFTDCA